MNWLFLCSRTEDITRKSDARDRLTTVQIMGQAGWQGQNNARLVRDPDASYATPFAFASAGRKRMLYMETSI